MDLVPVIRLVLLSLVTLVACEPALETLTPVGETRVDCQGVLPQHCQEALDQARAVLPVPLVELIVRCTAPPCTVQQGQTEIRARYADGTTHTSGGGWSQAVPAPAPEQPGVEPPPVALPVQPACLAVPAATCIEMATSAMTGLPPGSPPVGSITVRCTAVCTMTDGEGETLILFSDGTSMASGWGYSKLP